MGPPPGGLLQAAALGVVQGLTEFLPVSSSGHLILAREVLGIDAGALGLAFDVACHVGTLAAVVAYFWRDLAAMARAVPEALSWRPAGDARRLWLITAGTLPVIAVGVTAADVIESRLRAPVVAAVMLALVAVVLLAVERFGRRDRQETSLGLGEAVLLGCAQAAALVPGVSRSGATIATGMARGLRRDEAARFSFLLGVPAILAAAGKEGLVLVSTGFAPGEWQLFVVGAGTSAVVGYATVAGFLRYLARHSLGVFAWYRLAVAAAFAVWFLVR